MKLSEEVVASLKPGENLIAGYCHNRVGNGLLDFGLLVELDGYRSFHQTAQQTSVDVQPMQTYYTFTCGPVDLKLTFTALCSWIIWTCCHVRSTIFLMK